MHLTYVYVFMCPYISNHIISSTIIITVITITMTITVITMTVCACVCTYVCWC